MVRKTLASPQGVILDAISGNSAPSLAIPVTLRDQVIGIIHVESIEANRKWSESEISMVQSISERVALALENARLFENAQRRATREQMISEITTKIGATTNIDAILRSTVQELGRQIGKTEVTIEIGEQVMEKEMEA
jgi:transcriptional regulator with GAF, ATPase, and Fis domain